MEDEEDDDESRNQEEGSPGQPPPSKLPPGEPQGRECPPKTPQWEPFQQFPGAPCSKSVVNDIVTQHADKGTRDDKVLYTFTLCNNYQCTDRYQMRKHLSQVT